MLMKKRLEIYLILIIIFLMLPFKPLYAETIYAGTTVQSLVDAINRANELQGQNTIVLPSGCVYTLTQVNNEDSQGDNGLPKINSSLVIDGNNATISRSSSAPAWSPWRR